MINSSGKQVLPVDKSGSDAEIYLYKVREESAALPDFFSVASSTGTESRTAVPIAREAVHPQNDVTLNYEESKLDLYTLHKETCAVFGDMPRPRTDASEFYAIVHPRISVLPAAQFEPQTKEEFKQYIKLNPPLRLAYGDLFTALRAMLKLVPSRQVMLWAWCVLVQIPSVLTGSEIAVLRQVAKIEYQDNFIEAFRQVLAAKFGQTDLLEGNKRRKLD